MIKPFSSDTLTTVMDMLVLSVVLDQNISSEDLENPDVRRHLSGMLVELVRHNTAVSEVAAMQHLGLEKTEEVRTVNKKGVTFGVITGGKGL